MLYQQCFCHLVSLLPRHFWFWIQCSTQHGRSTLICADHMINACAAGGRLLYLNSHYFHTETSKMNNLDPETVARLPWSFEILQVQSFQSTPSAHCSPWLIVPLLAPAYLQNNIFLKICLLQIFSPSTEVDISATLTNYPFFATDNLQLNGIMKLLWAACHC